MRSPLARFLICSPLLILAACVESTGDSFDSSVETAVARTVTAQSPTSTAAPKPSPTPVPTLASTVTPISAPRPTPTPSVTTDPQPYLPSMTQTKVLLQQALDREISTDSMELFYYPMHISRWLALLAASGPPEEAVAEVAAGGDDEPDHEARLLAQESQGRDQWAAIEANTAARIAAHQEAEKAKKAKKRRGPRK